MRTILHRIKEVPCGRFMERAGGWLSRWVYYLASGLYFGAVFLRSLIIYWDSSYIVWVSGLLAIGLILFISESAVSRRWPLYFPFYLGLQTMLIFVLLITPGSPDFIAALLSVLSMQAMQRLAPKIGASWIGLCSVVTVLLLVGEYGGFQAVALGLVYCAGCVFFGSYTLAMRRAQEAGAQNQALAGELRAANQQLESYSAQLEQLAVVRERSRLARELHDSVTQTVFSMTLTTQSALLVLERDPNHVNAHLERLIQLARSALSEIRVLISELRPEQKAGDGLVPALQRALASGHYPDNLSIALEVEGDQPLQHDEEQGLLRIAEEALNNIVKHAQTSHAIVRLHLAEPFWMEVEDQGKGFELSQARARGRVGLSSMHERALEMGWNFLIRTKPGAGTCIRVDKAPIKEGQL